MTQGYAYFIMGYCAAWVICYVILQLPLLINKVFNWIKLNKKG